MKNITRIGIDCRFWGISHAGLGRYTRELVLQIIRKCGKDYHFTLFFNGEEWRNDKAILAKCQIIETGVPHYSVYKEQYELKKIIERENLNLMHFTHFNIPIFLNTPFIVTIHDLIQHFFKGRPVTTHSLPVYWLKYGGYRLVIHQAIYRSKAIITPSYFTKDQIGVHYKGVDPKLAVIYEGVSEPYSQNLVFDNIKTTKILAKYDLKNPYFIYTGSAYVSKNLDNLFLAFKQMLQKYPDTEIIVACARNRFWQKMEQMVKKLKIEDKVKLPGVIPDEDLICLYQNSIAFVMPSLMEGFGLPALEAMASGTLVLSSNTGSLPEIYGRYAVYFNPVNLYKMTDCLEYAINLNPIKRRRMIDKGIKHALNYTWDNAARQTVEVYQKTLEKLENI